MPLAASFKTTFLFLNNSPAGTADAPLRTFSQGFQVSFPRANLFLYVLMSRARVKSLPWTVIVRFSSSSLIYQIFVFRIDKP